MRLASPLLLATLTLFTTLIYANTTDIVFKTPDTLNVCSYSEFKPVIYGEGEGYEADLLRAVAELWQVKIHFFPERIYEGIWRLPSRQYTVCDVSAGGISPTLSRKQEDTEFSTMTTMFNQSLLIRKKDFDSGKITSYSSFKNTPMKIGIVPGTTGEKYAHARANENDLPTSIFVQYASEAELLPALLNHKIDAIARGEVGNEYQTSLDSGLITIAKKKCNEGFAFAVDKFNKNLLAHLNKSIGDITKNGAITYDDWVKDHTVFSQRAKELLGGKRFQHEPPVVNMLPQQEKPEAQGQATQPEARPMVMV
jgi:ABC-type amino acid transport substrate-binding protein